MNVVRIIGIQRHDKYQKLRETERWLMCLPNLITSQTGKRTAHDPCRFPGYGTRAASRFSVGFSVVSRVRLTVRFMYYWHSVDATHAMINNYSMNSCEQNVMWAYLYACIAGDVTKKAKNENHYLIDPRCTGICLQVGAMLAHNGCGGKCIMRRKRRASGAAHALALWNRIRTNNT